MSAKPLPDLIGFRNCAQIEHSGNSYRQNRRSTLTVLSHSRHMTSRPLKLPLRPMIALLLAFSADSPELTHEEIEAQIAELERAFAAEQS